jgi:3alpha(or 20beta)-hydroxysteroid dehydrogenase
MGTVAASQNETLSGKTIVISGGAQGIGAAVARVIVAHGGSVLIGDVAGDQAQGVAASLGPRAHSASLDVTDEPSWSNFVAEAEQRFGAVHGLVTCAGILRSSALTDFDLATFRRTLDVNLSGTFLGIKLAAPAMAKAGGGAMVLISSTEGLQGSNAMGAYASSKWGVRGLAKVAARELGDVGIRVNSIHPGPIDTPMLNPAAAPRDQISGGAMFARMPLPRAADPEEVGDLCAFLLGDGSRFITGAEIAIDGGLTSGNFTGTQRRVSQT